MISFSGWNLCTYAPRFRSGTKMMCFCGILPTTLTAFAEVQQTSARALTAAEVFT